MRWNMSSPRGGVRVWERRAHAVPHCSTSRACPYPTRLGSVIEACVRRRHRGQSRNPHAYCVEQGGNTCCTHCCHCQTGSPSALLDTQQQQQGPQKPTQTSLLAITTHSTQPAGSPQNATADSSTHTTAGPSPHTCSQHSSCRHMVWCISTCQWWQGHHTAEQPTRPWQGQLLLLQRALLATGCFLAGEQRSAAPVQVNSTTLHS